MKQNLSPKKRLSALLLSLSLVCLHTSIEAQTISTFAGNGTYGYSGDGGPATAATFNELGGVAIDATGNVFIIDASNVVLRKVNTSGTISTYAGSFGYGYSGDGGPATAADFGNLYGVAVDGAGNVYIGDGANFVVRKVNVAGIISTVAGTGVQGYSGDGGQATAAQISIPYRMSVDASGNLYIADVVNNVIRKVSTSGIITTVAGNGIHGYSGDGGQATAAKLSTPTSVAVDASGNLYISDFSNQRIRKVNASGIISTVAGNGTSGYSGDGGAATGAQLAWPIEVTIDQCGNLFIADASNVVIRQVNASGIISTIAGDGTYGYSGDGGAATNADLGVTGVAVDNSGNIYIQDSDNPVVRKVTYSCEGGKATPASIANGLDNNIVVFPNPANEVVYVTSGSDPITKIELMDITGRKVLEQTFAPTQKASISLAQLPQGTFMMRVNNTTSTVVSKN